MSLLLTGCSVAARQCESCPFHRGGLDLGQEKMAEITGYLLAGQNHMCHSDQAHKTVCRGGRQYQLEVWHRRGIISAPTDEALAAAMRACGIEPKTHIQGKR